MDSNFTCCLQSLRTSSGFCCSLCCFCFDHASASSAASVAAFAVVAAAVVSASAVLPYAAVGAAASFAAFVGLEVCDNVAGGCGLATRYIQSHLSELRVESV